MENKQNLEIPNSRHQQVQLEYDIWDYSSYANHYNPNNILKEDPKNSSSRWSSSSREMEQYAVLSLKKVSIVQLIGFGKYYLPHVCNLKRFKVFASLDGNSWHLVCYQGLKNDSEKEYFPLKYYKTTKYTEETEERITSRDKKIYIPAKYIKIVPLLTWGTSFNFGIWYVELRGVNSEDAVGRAFLDLFEYKQRKAIKLVLKFFGDDGEDTAYNKYLTPNKNLLCKSMYDFSDIYELMKQKTHIELDNDIIRELRRKLVLSGEGEVNYEFIEELVIKSEEKGYFTDKLIEINYIAQWEQIKHTETWPCARGGHQMTIEQDTGDIYLFGGWNGWKDMNDMWRFSRAEDKWIPIQEEGLWPSPRSVHRMIIDGEKGDIYTIGRYIDTSSYVFTNETVIDSGTAQDEHATELSGDFWKYNTNTREWFMLSGNTEKEGGPSLVYDTQICIDSSLKEIFVFGGKIISTKNTIECPYSGLYKYSINDNMWILVRSDHNQPAGTPKLYSRIGHSMLIDENRKELYIFGGQRFKDLLTDFIAYNYENDTVQVYISDLFNSYRKDISFPCDRNFTPPPSFTQRSIIDTERKEIIVMGGQFHSAQDDLVDEYMDSKGGAGSENSENTPYSQSMRDNKIWICYYSNYEGIKRSHFCSSVNYYKFLKNDLDFKEARISKRSSNIDSELNEFGLWFNIKSNDAGSEEPVPRYAHSFVYDHRRKIQYLFGGNHYSNGFAGGGDHYNREKSRLDDFWKLRLVKKSVNSLLKKMLFVIRRQQYFEMIFNEEQNGSLMDSYRKILEFVQVKIKEVVDWDDVTECLEFRSLPKYIFSIVSHNNESCDLKRLSIGDIVEMRRKLFDTLISFFPNYLKKPEDSIENHV